VVVPSGVVVVVVLVVRARCLSDGWSVMRVLWPCPTLPGGSPPKYHHWKKERLAIYMVYIPVFS
jgi:hypothetical protein